MTQRHKWLYPNDAIELVRIAQETEIPLLGFDAARITGGTTEPSLEDSWDYSSKTWPTVPDPYSHSLKFIKARSEQGLHFEIVLGEVTLTNPFS